MLPGQQLGLSRSHYISSSLLERDKQERKAGKLHSNMKLAGMAGPTRTTRQLSVAGYQMQHITSETLSHMSSANNQASFPCQSHMQCRGYIKELRLKRQFHLSADLGT